MKSRIRKSCHKQMLKEIKRTNESFKNDSWFNGRYQIAMADEFFYSSDRAIKWELYFIDTYNPLHTYMYVTDEHYYSSYDEFQRDLEEYYNYDENEKPKYAPVNLDFERSHIYWALNSWLQFCDQGHVSDSPPNCNMAWSLDANKRDHFINDHPNPLPKNKVPMIKEKISRMNSLKSILYNNANIKFDAHKGCEYKLAGFAEHDVYDISGLSWTYDYGLAIINDDNELECMIIKFQNKTYVVLYEYDDKYKAELRYRGIAVKAYNINSIDDIDDESHSLQCWMALNGDSESF